MGDIVMGVGAFLLGLVLGSFYNVVIYRMPLDLSVAKGRSMCPKCQNTLKAIDLVPLLSWVFLRGKCRYCRAPISWRYPLVELSAGLLFLCCYMRFGGGISFFLYAAFVSMLLITALIDYDHMLILDAVLISFGLPMVVLLLVRGEDLLGHLMGAGIGFGLFLLVYALARLIYKKEAFGFGDVLLMGVAGMVLKTQDTIVAILLAIYLAVIVILGVKLIGKRFNLKQEIPFGPFICAGACLALFFGPALVNWYRNLLG